MEQLQELDLSYELEKRKESLGAVACEILEKSDGGGKQKWMIAANEWWSIQLLS